MDESRMSEQQLQDAGAIRLVQQLLPILYNRQNTVEASMKYTEDCYLSYHLQPSVQGRAGMQAAWTSLADMGLVRLEFFVEEFYMLTADLAIVSTTATSYNTNGEELGKYKGLKIWKKINGQWLVHIELIQPADSAGEKYFLKQQ